MAREKEEMQSVTIRIPKDLYADYKKTLLAQGKIVTYDVRKYMNEVVEINQLSSTTIIKGQHLVVPYYEATYK